MFALVTLVMYVLVGSPSPVTIRPRSVAANGPDRAVNVVPTRVPDAVTAGLSDEIVGLIAEGVGRLAAVLPAAV